jgi:hypothetical protein
MKNRQLSFTLLSLLVAVLAGLVWWGSTPASAAFTSVLSNSLSPVGGAVIGQPESVVFAGLAKIDSKMVTDPDFGNPPNVVLSIDLSGVSGVGLSTKTKYVTASREIVIRPLAATDQVEIDFPFYQSGTDASVTSRTGQVTFALSFDLASGTLTGALGIIATTAP